MKCLYAVIRLNAGLQPLPVAVDLQVRRFPAISALSIISGYNSDTFYDNNCHPKLDE